MSRIGLFLLCLWVAGCALRPRYSEFVDPKLQGSEIALQLVSTVDGRPMSQARIEVGEGKWKYQTTTDAQGRFKLPIQKRYQDDNSLVVVTLPGNASGYRIVPAPSEPPAPPPLPNAVPSIPKPDPLPDGGTGDDGVTRL